MRYEPDHKEKTRKQIVATAAQLFRKDGVVATGVVGLMKGAGLTQGGFYAHFESKEALIRESLVSAMVETATGLARLVPPDAPPGEQLKALFDAYLSPRHMHHPERGCAIAAAVTELVREPDATRDAVTAATDQLVDLVARLLPPGHDDPKALARTVFALLSGTMQFARMRTNEAEAEAILDNGKKAALTLCGVAG